MSEDVWSQRDTTPDAIETALRELLRERHAADQALAPARVLNLVVVADREWKGEIANRLQRVGRYHASRTVLCAVEPGRDTLDATVVMAYEDPKDGLGIIRERIELDIGPAHLTSLRTVVDPVIVAALPTVLWCPHGHEDGQSSLLSLADVVLYDSDSQADAAAGIAGALELLSSAYVVDLAWLRTTPWRERLAASFDPPARRDALRQIGGLGVRHRPGSEVSALLLAGWLAARLEWEPSALSDANGAGLRGTARYGDSELSVELESRAQDSPGLGGVTVECRHGFSLSLDRGPGGLRAHRRTGDGREASWRVLGASRGEGGILGEGVRQALLRDPTYGPALRAAQAFCPA